MKARTPDLTTQNIEKIAALFPNCVTELPGKDGSCRRGINFELLRQMLTGTETDVGESYEFNWVGKKAAIVEASRPAHSVMLPCPEESVDWDTTQNLYIEGDGLEALKILRQNYLGKIKVIYIDPPYNTGSDFIYRDSFKMSTEDYQNKFGEQSGESSKSAKRAIYGGRFHSDWCSMIYPRLMLARELLSEDGAIFISIDDNELDNLRKICSEIFGEDSFVACFPRITKKAGKSSGGIAKNHDYLLMYAKAVDKLKVHQPRHEGGEFNCRDEYFDNRGYYRLNQTLDYNSLRYSSGLDYPIELEGQTFYPGGSREKYEERQRGKHGRADWAWRWSKELFEFGLRNGFVVVKRSGGRPRLYTKTYQRATIVKQDGSWSIVSRERTKPLSSLEFTNNKYSNDNAKKNLIALFGSSVFDYSKPTALIEAILRFASDPDSIVLDFFSGSAATAHATMKLNSEDGGRRKFIMVQLSEACKPNSEAAKAGYKNICEIGQERIRRAGVAIRRLALAGSSPAQCCLNGCELPWLDTGFKVCRLDEACCANSNSAEDALNLPEEQLSEFTNSAVISPSAKLETDGN
ncbi:MAG: site-specific DNA-methyltransferase [bacterium]|nr:site-specific DNA-methyltransferase [bacterium]